MSSARDKKKYLGFNSQLKLITSLSILINQVWINAAAQVFNSVGIAFGSMICFASYNRFHNTVLVDTVAVSLINAFSSLLVGIFSFATIGNIAREQNMSVEDVLTDGTYKIRNEVYVTLNMINYVSINLSMSRALWRERA